MSPTPLRSGEMLGPFRLHERLAVGGMAEVWRVTGPRSAEDLAPPAPLALKLMRPHPAEGEDHYARFLDELRISRRLRHANIVTVFDGMVLDGHLVQSMELLEGVDLRRLSRVLEQQRRPFPVAHALWVGRMMARALAYAHAMTDRRGLPMQVVHRDVSPHNVMLTFDGEVKVLDFGIAKARERLVETRGAVAKGKTAYMAPEQVMARPLDARADVFAAGIVLWEALAGRRLFRGRNEVETMQRVRRGVVPDPSRIRPELPAEAAELVLRMLARRPEDRPADMEAVERTLQRVLVQRFEPEAVGPAALRCWLGEVFGPGRLGTVAPRTSSRSGAEPSAEPSAASTDGATGTDPD